MTSKINFNQIKFSTEIRIFYECNKPFPVTDLLRFKSMQYMNVATLDFMKGILKNN